MTPSRKYELLMTQPGFVTDPAQQRSIALLDDLFHRLCNERPLPWWRRPFAKQGRYHSLGGLYLWGGVGRGKTLLMDLFYRSLPQEVRSERVHFHQFMNRVHARLADLRETADPLRRVAQDLAAGFRVLCLDEFVVTDIGDAMILAGLLEALFAEGVVLVTTSNAAPDDLYRDGLQRARFIPAIEAIKHRCEVVNLDGAEDYRLRFLRRTELYSVPHDHAAEAAIHAYLQQHVAPVQAECDELTINGRSLAYRFCAEDTVWFSFDQLCATARSQNDYLELARLFTTLILTDIPRMHDADNDIARRFVLLVDVLYDHRVKLICSAAAEPGELYRGKRLGFEFERTASRLVEMQSQTYLARAHTLQ